MAKLVSFFRRLFPSIQSDEEICPSSSDSRKSTVIIPPLTPPAVSIRKPTPSVSRSCTTTPRTITKQTTIQVDSPNGHPHVYNLTSKLPKPSNRRLSAPLIIHASTLRQHRSTVVDGSTEEALISPLQRLSLSSTTGTSIHHNHSVNSLGTSAAGSAGASPRNELSSSFNLSPSNSIHLPSSLNNISSVAGR